jgi:hypothetical protein
VHPQLGGHDEIKFKEELLLERDRLGGMRSVYSHGLTPKVRGSMFRSYLWMQIIAGWLLSAIFIAVVTGLLRND